MRAVTIRFAGRWRSATLDEPGSRPALGAVPASQEPTMAALPRRADRDVGRRAPGSRQGA